MDCADYPIIPAANPNPIEIIHGGVDLYPTRRSLLRVKVLVISPQIHLPTPIDRRLPLVVPSFSVATSTGTLEKEAI